MDREEKYKKLIRYAQLEHQDRIIGIIEFYITTLGDGAGEKTAKHLLENCIKTINANALGN